MQLTTLFDMQRQLDAFIEQAHNISQDVFAEKGLALLVELAELANETRCFKYWSTKGASERSVLLEEFVDSIHFILSLGNLKGYQLMQWPEAREQASLTALFLQTTTTISTFISIPTMRNYEEIWLKYSSLAHRLGFTSEEILAAYQLKHKKNYERQRAGY